MTYTISGDILENIEENDWHYWRNLLFKLFYSDKKIAKDSEGHIFDIYRDVTKNREMLNQWINIGCYKPSKFVNVDLRISQIQNVEEKFIALCAATKGERSLVVDDIQAYSYIRQDNTIEYKGDSINVIDKDAVVIEISENKVVNTITNSIFAGGNINNSDILNKNE